MTNQKQQLKELVRRTNNPCGDCDGEGTMDCSHESHFISVLTSHDCNGSELCPTCSGKGYKEELDEGLLETLSGIEHEQWVKWSKSIAESEIISKNRLERWISYWMPYSKLSDEIKEYDREYARIVIKTIGTPLKFEELLLALSKSKNVESFMLDSISTYNLQLTMKDSFEPLIGMRTVDNEEEITILELEIPLNLSPSEYPEELLKKLIEILK